MLLTPGLEPILQQLHVHLVVHVAVDDRNLDGAGPRKEPQNKDATTTVLAAKYGLILAPKVGPVVVATIWAVQAQALFVDYDGVLFGRLRRSEKIPSPRNPNGFVPGSQLGGQLALPPN